MVHVTQDEGINIQLRPNSTHKTHTTKLLGLHSNSIASFAIIRAFHQSHRLLILKGSWGDSRQIIRLSPSDETKHNNNDKKNHPVLYTVTLRIALSRSYLDRAVRHSRKAASPRQRSKNRHHTKYMIATFYEIL